MQNEEIEQLIKASFKDAMVMVEGDGRHFTTAVICDLFAGKSRVERQRLVHEALHQHLDDGRLHAISIKTFTKEEWQKLIEKTT